MTTAPTYALPKLNHVARFACFVLQNVFLFIVTATPQLFAQTSSTGTLQGKVYDDDRNSLSGASVQIRSLRRGAITKRDGSYTLSQLPEGTHSLEISSIGFEPYTKTIVINSNKTTELTVVMKQSPLLANEVSVTGSRRKQEQSDTRTSVITVDPREAKFKAGAVEDVFRTLQSMPGVVAPSDFSSQLVIRGSGPDQNLILMDNIEIFNPYRLYGFISLFNPETVSGITLLTGGFGAKYSDRLSAVLDVTNRDGYTGKGYFAGKVNISLTNANAVTEGALPFWNGSWLVSARRTYYDVIAGPIARASGAIDGDVALPNFRDLQAKITLFPHQNHKVMINGLTSRDNTMITSGTNRKNVDSISITDRSFNDVLGATWVWTPSDNFFSTTGISYYSNRGANSFGGQGGSGQVFGTEGQLSQEEFIRLSDSLRSAGIDIPTLFSVNGETGFNFQKTSIRNDNTWKIDSSSTLEFGLQHDWLYTGVIANFEFDPRLIALRKSNPRVPPLPTSFENGVSYIRSGLYAQQSTRITKELTVQGGLRLDYFALIDRVYLAPRLSTSYAFSPTTTLRAAYGTYYQSPGYEKLFDAQVFLDLTSENVQKLRAEQAQHYILGLEHMISAEWQFKVETYYKGFTDLILPEKRQGTVWTTERIPGLADSVYRTRQGWTTPVASIGDSLTTIPVNSATGEAFGIEFMLQKIQSLGDNTLYGWISYSFAIANRYRDGLTIPFNFDRRHSLNIVGGYKYADWLDISFTFTYGTGFPWTKAVGIRPRVVVTTDTLTQQQNGKIDNDWRGVIFDVDRGGLTNINQSRLPDYHRLDIRFTTYSKWFGFDWSWYLDIINVYNHNNIIAEQYRVNRSTLELTTRQSSMLPILPTIGFSCKF